MINSTASGMPYKWDSKNITHRVEGSEVHPGITLLWTLCGKDVPANTAYADWEHPISCQKCLSNIKELDD